MTCKIPRLLTITNGSMYQNKRKGKEIIKTNRNILLALLRKNECCLSDTKAIVTGEHKI